VRLLEKLLLIAGFVTMAGLFWKLDPGAVWKHIEPIGLGMILILGQQFIDHAFNSWGWAFSFTRKDAQGVSFWRLFLIRISGDGVNYLTPTATIAGEVVRPAMLGDAAPEEVKIASVVVARFTQSVGQALFIMIGLLSIAWIGIPGIEHLPLMGFIREWLFIPGGILALTLSTLIVYSAWAWKNPEARKRVPLAGNLMHGVRGEITSYFRSHPGRFCLSILFFCAGYWWGCVEVWLICRFMGLEVTPLFALTIEVLSSTFDGVLFMVPAKIGTQELGKTAIFKGLGLPAAQGLAFGLVRHIRELVWACAGFTIYALHRRKALATE
jgi:hypothetical protein